MDTPRPKGVLPGERRRAPRRKVLFTAKVVLEDGVTHECGVADVSPEGAGLKLGRFVELPDAFHLIILRTGVAHHCQVRWRIAPWVGVSFDQTWDLRTAQRGQPPRLRELWLDCEARAGPASAG